MFYSIIIPVYNRPDEIKELLESFTFQTSTNFEVIIVEDGSSVSCKSIAEHYESSLPIHYYYKENSGPGIARNYGASKSSGDFLIFLDSDCVIPSDYIEIVDKHVTTLSADAFGGPDKAANTFTTIQKAINYSMTSFFTTGGIRGGRKRLDRFYPRTFNMGIKKTVFMAVGQFAPMRFGEDIDLSIRIIENGYTSCFFEDAWVYHKRRTTLRKFFKQVYHSGKARVFLWQKYPDTLKTVHLLPSLFTLYCFVSVLLTVLSYLFIIPLFVIGVALFIDAFIKTKDFKVSILAVAASFVQLIGYGSGFIIAFLKSAYQ